MRYYVSAISRGVRVEGHCEKPVTYGIRTEFVEMPEDYRVEDDIEDAQRPFLKLRDEFCKVAKSHISYAGEKDTWRPEIITILGITPVSYIGVINSVTLDERVSEVLNRLNLSASVADVLPYLPDCALELDDESFRNAVTAAIKLV